MKGGLSTTYMVSNLNKRHVFLDLSRPKDLEEGKRLLREADVFVENFRPGGMDRLGMGYEAARELNPRIVYASLPAYGSRGPLRDMGGVETYGAAMSGFMSLNGTEGGQPEAFRLAHIDLTAGSYAAEGILIALYQVAFTGKGMRVEVAHMEGGFAVSATRCEEFLVGNEVPKPMGSGISNTVPSRAFQGADGRFFALEVRTAEEWQSLCAAIDRNELAMDSRFASNADRVRHRTEIDSLLATAFARSSAAAWVECLSPTVPCALYADDLDSFVGQRFDAWPMIQPVLTGRGVLNSGGLPWRFSRTPATAGAPPDPELAESMREASIDWLSRESVTW